MSISFDTDIVRIGVSKSGLGFNGTKTIDFLKMMKASNSSDVSKFYSGQIEEFISVLNRDDCDSKMCIKYFPLSAYATIPPNITYIIHLKEPQQLPKRFSKHIKNN
jgi:hypothetical protein